MSRNNVKLLTPEQLRLLKEKYIFNYDGENVVVQLSDYNRITKHDAKQKFHINSKIRKIIFIPEVIEYWIELGVKNYSLLDVQQAANKLYVMYQPLTLDNLKKVLHEK